MGDNPPWISPTAIHFLGRPHPRLYLSHLSGLYLQQGTLWDEEMFYSGQHAGFYTASLKVEGSLNHYMSRHSSDQSVTFVGLGDKRNQHKHGVHVAGCTVNNEGLFL